MRNAVRPPRSEAQGLGRPRARPGHPGPAAAPGGAGGGPRDRNRELHLRLWLQVLREEVDWSTKAPEESSFSFNSCLRPAVQHVVVALQHFH